LPNILIDRDFRWTSHAKPGGVRKGKGRATLAPAAE
jgi:hypothetical protein